MNNPSQHNIAIVFPHQLFEKSPLINTCEIFYLVEEWLFFSQYSFHKQKIAYHRASMKWYASFLEEKKKQVIYIDSSNEASDIRKLIAALAVEGVESFSYIDPTDNWLEKRINSASKKAGIIAKQRPQQLFINSKPELAIFFEGKKQFFMADFYTYQRRTRNILLESNGKPIGGKWSFDAENRLKYPKNKIPPSIDFSSSNPFYKDAIEYTEKNFGDNYGYLETHNLFPSTHTESKTWLSKFFTERFSEFGPFEDAIVSDQHILHHSVLTPMLNTGLLQPDFVISETLQFASENNIPVSSIEGFIRQIIGWREYMRAVYEFKGVEERTTNFWNFKRKIPLAFWNASTGIIPVDKTISKVLETGYCHHIERLMILGNFMLLCEFDPDEVYRWFMELFIDAYDWVMVPNVYGMSQFSDGGKMSTKPYISGSNYILKMSDYRKGDWQITWDALFWRFMYKHRDFFGSNPRLGMLLKTFDKMPAAKQNDHIERAEAYLKQLDKTNDR